MTTQKETKSATKETKSTVATSTGTALKEAQEAKVRASMQDLFIPNPAYKEDGSKRIAPQMKLIITTIHAAGKGGVTRDLLCKTLTGVLVTRQPVNRVVTYYQKPMIELGAITIAKGQ